METLLPKTWEEVISGDRIRWSTPRFVKRGKVLDRRGESLLVWLDDEPTGRAIPIAKWYFDQSPDAREHLVVIADDGKRYKAQLRELREDEVWLSSQEAAALIGVEPKILRRYLRSGQVLCQLQDGRWLVERGSVLKLAGDRGWI